MEIGEWPAAAERAAVAAFGEPSGRASVAFVGVETLEVLRFGPGAGGLVRYLTLGMSRHGDGPPAELLLTVREPADGVLRALAVLAAMPAVEGVIVRPGSVYELGEPLWPGSEFTGFAVGPEELPGCLPVIPLTAGELAFRRRHGAGALERRWAGAGTDLRDPRRSGAADAQD